MKFPPKVGILRWFRGEPPDYITLAGEAIDNSLDAGAYCISIALASDRLVFVDNGRGIRKKKIEAFFAVGDHAPMPTTRLGRFGSGITW